MARKRSMTLDIHLLISFVPVFIVSMLFFILILEMVDVFTNIVQYVQNEVPFSLVLKSMLLYMPSCASFALPLATLFSVAFTLGTMYANNELIVIFSSGISLVSFITPLILTAIVLSGSFFVFSDQVVIPTLIQKKNLTGTMLRTGDTSGIADITLVGKNKDIVWNVQYFDRNQATMTGVIVVQRDSDGKFISRINAQSAVWTGTLWTFSNVRRFFWKDENLTDAVLASWENENFDEPPDSFISGGKSIDEMTMYDTAKYIQFLKRAGLPTAVARSEFYRRFAFALTPLAVTLMSAALISKFKKNILLMSLLLSLIAATVYYVAQMVFMLFAKAEAVPPLLGAFAPLAICILLMAALLKFRSV